MSLEILCKNSVSTMFRYCLLANLVLIAVHSRDLFRVTRARPSSTALASLKGAVLLVQIIRTLQL